MAKTLVRPRINVSFLDNLLLECRAAREIAARRRRYERGLDLDGADDSETDDDAVADHVAVVAERSATPVGSKDSIFSCDAKTSVEAAETSEVSSIREDTSQKGDEETDTGESSKGTVTGTAGYPAVGDLASKAISSATTECLGETNDTSDGQGGSLCVSTGSGNSAVISASSPCAITYQEFWLPDNIAKRAQSTNPEGNLDDVRVEILANLLPETTEIASTRGEESGFERSTETKYQVDQVALPGPSSQSSPPDQSDRRASTSSTEAYEEAQVTYIVTLRNPTTNTTMTPSDTTGDQSPKLASRPLLPEYGPRVTVAGGRVICKAHDKGICRICGTDYTDITLLDKSLGGLTQAEAEYTLNYRDKTGVFIPVFEHGGGDFAEKDALERETEFPSNEIHDLDLGVSHDKGNSKMVSAAAGPEARFIPQWDPEAMGKSNVVYLKPDYRNPPKDIMGLDRLALVHCKRCQLTWHGGYQMEETAKSHPSHHCAYDPVAGPSRSLFVRVDGAFIPGSAGGLGGGARAARAGMGVYFGAGSKHNVSEAFGRRVFAFPAGDARNGDHPAVAMTQVTPQLAAVVLALRTVRERVVPQRVAAVRAVAANNSRHAAVAAEKFRLIVCVDSAELMDLLVYRHPADHAARWLDEGLAASARKAEKDKGKGKGKKKKGAKDGSAVPVDGHVSWDDFVPDKKDRKLVLVNRASGCLVTNSDGILMVARETALLANEGVAVRYYLIPAKDNAAADKLAKKGMNLE